MILDVIREHLERIGQLRVLVLIVQSPPPGEVAVPGLRLIRIV